MASSVHPPSLDGFPRISPSGKTRVSINKSVGREVDERLEDVPPAGIDGDDDVAGGDNFLTMTLHPFVGPLLAGERVEDNSSAESLVILTKQGLIFNSAAKSKSETTSVDDSREREEDGNFLFLDAIEGINNDDDVGG